MNDAQYKSLKREEKRLRRRLIRQLIKGLSSSPKKKKTRKKGRLQSNPWLNTTLQVLLIGLSLYAARKKKNF